MRYKTNIIQRGNKYVGQLLLDGQSIYTTPELNDPVLVSRDLASQAAALISPAVGIPNTIPPPPSSTYKDPSVQENHLHRYTPNRQNSSPRKCCGRG